MYEMTAGEDRAEGAHARHNDTPARRCIMSGDTLPREMLIRFVVGPDGIVVPDLSERLPGRGLWVTGRHDMLEQACAKGAFHRAARGAVMPLVGPNGEDLAALVDAQLTRRCIEALGLARRAGQLIVGFGQVRATLKGMIAAAGSNRKSAVLLAAQDAAADGHDKLRALAERVNENGAEVTQLALFDAKTLGRAIGRDQIVHALLETDKVGKRQHVAMWRLAVYRGVVPLVELRGAELAPADVVDME